MLEYRRVYVAGRVVQCVRCDVPILPGHFQKAQGKNARCLRCAGLAHLTFVPSGDVALTRRALEKSRKKAVVLKYNRRRRRYERVGIFVELDALWHARHQCRLDAEERTARREHAHAQTKRLDAVYVLRFASRIRDEFPEIPIGIDRTIAERACVRGSRRVGRSRRAFHRRAVFRAVCAHIRHHETSYESLLASGLQITQARKAVQPALHEVLRRWRRPIPSR